jgi:hypothetical protein
VLMFEAWRRDCQDNTPEMGSLPISPALVPTAE